ncbi:MAG: SMC-Scp complex subunit ScpB [bacterium]
MLTPPAAIEALLFASGEPLEKKRIISLLNLKDAEFELALKALKGQLDGHGVSIIETKDEIEMRTSPETAGVVKKLRESELSRDLGKASMETLSVIAYQTGGTDGGGKGATRGEIDWVRGVNSSASLRTLLMRGLIEGREDERDRRRIRYNLTTEALAHLGLSRTEDLPRYNELASGTNTIIEEEVV